jgi:hypothetical protein
MSWKVTLPPTQGIGRSVMRIEHEITGAGVELRGPEGALLELGGLLDAGEAALDRARQSLSAGKIAYHVVFAGPRVGISSCTILRPAPGIRSTADLNAVQAAIAKEAGLDGPMAITVLSWTELELVPEIEIAQAIPAGVPMPANLVG